ncbi:putative metallophosphoesterase [Burkholderia pseudomallei ABCPW 107]|nr:putative metallophosphoesterase [Burkholderia pseudomallei ABCPW 107]
MRAVRTNGDIAARRSRRDPKDQTRDVRGGRSMPPVRNDTARVSRGRKSLVRAASKDAAATDAAGKPAPTQHDRQVEHACAWS